MTATTSPSPPDEFTLKVNGIEMTMATATPVAHDILELAEKHNAMPGKPEDYRLQGDKREYGWDERVDLREDSHFLTIPKGATPVA